MFADTTDGKIYLSYPLLRTIQRNFIATVAFETKDSSVDIGGEPAARDRYRWVSIAGTYDDTILGNNVVTEITFSQGLDGLGSNGDNTDFSFLSAEGSVSRDLTETTSVVLRFAGQLALTQIPSAMTFGLGGEAFTPAFDSSTLAGEDGIAVALEVNRMFQTPWQWLPAVTLFSFVDYGAVWNGPDVSDYTFASLGSVGAGVRARLGRHANVSALVAVPYKDEPDLDASGDTRFRFTAGLRF